MFGDVLMATVLDDRGISSTWIAGADFEPEFGVVVVFFVIRSETTASFDSS